MESATSRASFHPSGDALSREMGDWRWEMGGREGAQKKEY